MPHGASRNQRRIFVGDLIEAEPGWAEVEVRNRFALGDTLELMTPHGNHVLRLERLEALSGEPLEVAPGSGWRVRIPVPEPVGDRALLTRVLESS
jgi:U32 family peptidase